jgi:hypothetical protein
LDQVDAIFTDFVAALDVTIKTGRTCMCLAAVVIHVNLVTVNIRQKAIEVALSVVSGAYQTSLLSYFTHRDLFPSLMKVRNSICWHVQADVGSLFKILIPLLAHLSLLLFLVYWQICQKDGR